MDHSHAKTSPEPCQPVFHCLLFCCICTLFAGCIFSTGFPDLNAGRLEKLIKNEKRLVIVDNRTALEYASGHIPGAIHIPQEEFFRIASYLPEKKDTPIVFYCRGYG